MTRLGPRSCWELHGDLRLSQLIDWCRGRHAVDRLLLTSRASTSSRLKRYVFDPRIGRRARTLLGDQFLRVVRARAWPGTRLIGHSDLVYQAILTDDVVSRMVEAEDFLFNWNYNHRLPEDICLYRAGAELPVLVSVTHEREAWIVSKYGAEVAGAVRVRESPEELFVTRESGQFLPPGLREARR